jgi:hypothetical protein
VVIAIWAKGLTQMYDAYDVARALGYEDRHIGRHFHEFLVHGSIDSDSSHPGYVPWHDTRGTCFGFHPWLTMYLLTP